MTSGMGPKGDQDYTFAMRYILFFIILIISTPHLMADEQPVRALMKIQGSNLLISENKAQVPSVAGNDQVKATMELLKDGDEVMVEGRIHEEVVSYGDFQKVNTYFIIDKLHKISLSELGNIIYQIPDPEIQSTSNDRLYTPVSLPVTAQVATAMTMTTAALLMENLSGEQNIDPEGRRQIRQSLILSAGLMATFIFIYEQYSGSSKP